MNRSEFQTVTKNSLSGFSIARAPDGTVAFQADIERGKASKNHNNLFYLSSLGNPGVDAACMSVRIFLQSGFEWPVEGGTKMAWGLWGGDRTTYVGGGATPSQQTGWSVRNVNSKWGYRLYSYHLNRSQNGTHGEYSPDWSPRWGTSDWNAGRWHTIELEVKMNTPGRSDGYTQHWLNGKRIGAMNNLQFRRNTNWAIRGLMFHEMWQAASPKAQKMWYADYKFYTGGGGAVVAESSPSTPQSSGGSTPPSSSPPPSSDSNSGSFGAVAPQGTVNGRNLVVTWTPDSRAERYYVKVQTRSTKAAVFGKVAWPAQSCSATQCSLNIGDLPNGDYDWMVRPQNGSTAIAPYSQMSISVQSSGSAQSSESPATGSGGAFGAVAPQGTVDGRNLMVTWKPDSRAERYYVKVQAQSNKSSVFGKVAWPTSSCSASKCSLDVGNLPKGDYDWMVRPQDGHTALASYSQLSISVR